MTSENWSPFVKEKAASYSADEIIFTKDKIIDWLCQRNKTTIEAMKEDILNPRYLVFTEKQEIEHEDQKEERYRCYFVYSNSRGRCYILKFNSHIKIITAFPLGRSTLKRYRKRFK